jgi:hypothetical protein
MTVYDDMLRFEKSTVGELFTHDPGAIMDFVCRAFSGDISREDLTRHQMFWYSVASTAKFYAFTAGTDPCDVDLEWARLANVTYGFLASLPGREHVMASWMGLKARLIACLGDTVDRSLADPDEVLTWFQEILTLPFAEVERLVSGPPSALNREQDAAVSIIKEGARLVYYLRETPEYRACGDYQKWVELFRLDAGR